MLVSSYYVPDTMLRPLHALNSLFLQHSYEVGAIICLNGKTKTESPRKLQQVFNNLEPGVTLKIMAPEFICSQSLHYRWRNSYDSMVLIWF